MASDGESPHEAQHARLLEGLAASIREKGLASTQVADIVRHARASRRTFYNHFPDKDSCFVELLDTTSRWALDRVADAIDLDAPLAAQVDTAVDAYLRLLLEDPALTASFYQPGLSPGVVRAQNEGIERYAELLARNVRTVARRDPSVTPMSQTVAFMLISGLAHAIGRAIDRGQDVRKAGREAKAVILAVALRPAPAPPRRAPARATTR